VGRGAGGVRKAVLGLWVWGAKGYHGCDGDTGGDTVYVGVLGGAMSLGRQRGGEWAELRQGRQELRPAATCTSRGPPLPEGQRRDSSATCARGGSDAGGVPGTRGRLWGGQGSRTHISGEAQCCSHAHVRPFARPAPPLRDFSSLSKPPSLPPSEEGGRTDRHWRVSDPPQPAQSPHQNRLPKAGGMYLPLKSGETESRSPARGQPEVGDTAWGAVLSVAVVRHG